MAQVLLVDEYSDNSDSLISLLRESGHTVYSSPNVDDALRLLSLDRVETALTRVRVATESDALRVLWHVKGRIPAVEVVVLTARGTIRGAVEAVRRGAFDYLTMPIDPDDLLQTVQAASVRRRAASVESAIDLHANGRAFENIVTDSPVMRGLLARALQLAGSDLPVLIAGESGTGKELIARAVHRASRRASGQFVPLNCGAVPETLVESELFGHKKGAFSGAIADKKGLTEEAHNGTLFLDEIGDMPPYVQVSVLRFLDSGELRSVGDTRIRHADVRVVAATHRHLPDEIKQGRFRRDLFYRLSAVSLYVPPLRERPDDVLLLARYYLRQASLQLGKSLRGFSNEALSHLRAFAWPGNVRQLKWVIAGAAAIAVQDVITATDLDLESGVDDRRTKSDDVAESELERLRSILARCNGNHREAASALGISRTTLWRRLRRTTGQVPGVEP